MQSPRSRCRRFLRSLTILLIVTTFFFDERRRRPKVAQAIAAHLVGSNVVSAARAASRQYDKKAALETPNSPQLSMPEPAVTSTGGANATVQQVQRVSNEYIEMQDQTSDTPKPHDTRHYSVCATKAPVAVRLSGRSREQGRPLIGNPAPGAG